MSDKDEYELWHYTNYDSFKKIVESNEIRFTLTSCLNDSTEFVHGVNVLIDEIQNTPKYNQRFKNHLVNGINNFSRDTQVFVFSLCMKKDYLPLWMCYGDHGYGLSIKLKREAFGQIGTDENMFLTNIIYEENEIRREVQDEFIELVENEDFEAVNNSILNILPLAFILKNNDFSFEEEARYLQLRIVGHPHQNYNKNDIRTYTKLISSELTQDESMDKSFVVGNLCNNCIEKIIIGPACDFNYAHRMITSLLKDTPYSDVEILYSDKALR